MRVVCISGHAISGLSNLQLPSLEFKKCFNFKVSIYGIIGLTVVIGILGNLFIKKFRMKDWGVNPIVFHDHDKSVIRYLSGGILFGLGWALSV